MAQNLKFDPAKRDYVVVNGSPVPSDDVKDAAYIALLIPKNKWLYGTPDQGSYLYTLANQKRTSSVEADFAAYTKDALTIQLVKTGKATEFATRNLDATPTGTSNQIGVVPNETQLSNKLKFVGV